MLYCLMVSEEMGYGLRDLITTILMICVLKKNSLKTSSLQSHCRIQMREFLKKGSENVAFFYNNL